MVTQTQYEQHSCTSVSDETSRGSANTDPKALRVLLVGNYQFDGSTSMHIWGDALLRELHQLGINAKLIVPKPFLGRIKPSSTGLGKWLGYGDRFLLFPPVLRAAASQADVVHICDHGGAMYALRLPDKRVLVTCHDMLALRGALGELPDFQPSPFGGFLQRWIRRGMRSADLIACVSHYTFADVRRILNEDGNLCVVLNGLNYPFQPIPPAEVDARLAALHGIDHPFILHVGSSHKRKNREGVLRVFARVAQGTDLKLVFAGQPLSANQSQLAHELGLDDRVVQLVKPDVKLVEALYNRAVALLFPSRYEGFGWPPIEAQACGCPVVASDIPPLVEVVSASGVIRSLEDEAGMAESILRLAADHEYRKEIRERGFENVRSRFQTTRMMEQYVSLYRALACQ